MPLWLLTALMNLKKLPWAKMMPYILVIGAILFAGGFGFYKGNERADHRIAAYELELKNKADVVTDLQNKLNAKVTVEYRDRVKPIYVERGVNKNLAETVVPNTQIGNLPAGWPYVYNVSLMGGPADPKKAADATDSGVSSNQALAVITDNNATCRIELARFDELQKWIVQSQQNVAEANKKGKKK